MGMWGFERSWADAVLAAFAPITQTPAATDPERSATPPPSLLAPRAGEVDYLAVFDEMRLRSAPIAAFGLRLAVWIVVFAPVWLRLRLGTLASLAPAERAALLDRLLRHRSRLLRELSLMLKLTAAIALLGSESVRARSGYDRVQQYPWPVLSTVGTDETEGSAGDDLTRSGERLRTVHLPVLGPDLTQAPEGRDRSRGVACPPIERSAESTTYPQADDPERSGKSDQEVA